MLYVLFESMHEPVRWMRLYEWREMADMEVAAIATLWKYIGEMMDIDYRAELGKDQWKDGIEFMDDVAAWAAEYENRHLGPSPDIAKLGQVLVELMLSAYPSFSRAPGYKILMVLMGERMRHAFGWASPFFSSCSAVFCLSPSWLEPPFSSSSPSPSSSSSPSPSSSSSPSSFSFSYNANMVIDSPSPA
jgi:hypothetical protein